MVETIEEAGNPKVQPANDTKITPLDEQGWKKDGPDGIDKKQLGGATNEIHSKLTEPAQKLTEPALNLTDVALDSTEPALKLTEPAQKLTEPVLNLTEPALNLTDVALDSTEPALKLTEPVLRLTEPALNLTDVALDSTEPALKSTEPAQKSTEPVLRLTEPALKLTDVALDSTEPAQKSTEPALNLTDVALDSTEPALKSTEPVVRLTEPALNLTGSIANKSPTQENSNKETITMKQEKQENLTHKDSIGEEGTKTQEQTEHAEGTAERLKGTETHAESTAEGTVEAPKPLTEDIAIQKILMRDRRVVEEGGGDGALPIELAEEAEWDIHEKTEWIDRDVQALREMVEAEASLKSRLDTPFLLSFLRARKFDYDKAMSMIRSYYKARQENAEMYVNLVPSALDQVWPLKMQTVLPTPDALGRTVIVFRTGSWLPEVCGLDDVFRSQVLILEHVVRIPVTQLRGVCAVVDCAGLSMTHAYYLTPTHIRRMISVIQEVFPLRFKALHFVNEPQVFDWIFSLIKPFLSDTIKARLHFHGEDLNSLHQHIPPLDLPHELGGNGGPMDNTTLVENLRVHENYFSDHFSYGFETCEGEEARGGGVMEAVSDMGSLIGSYYRRMCID